MLRADRFIQTLNHIMDNRDSWHQEEFISECGSYRCFAGFADMLSGTPGKQLPVRKGTETTEEFELRMAEYQEYHKGIWHRAQKWLGLTDEEARGLFHPDTGIDGFICFLNSKNVDFAIQLRGKGD